MNSSSPAAAVVQKKFIMVLLMRVLEVVVSVCDTLKFLF